MLGVVFCYGLDIFFTKRKDYHHYELRKFLEVFLEYDCAIGA